LHQLIRDSGNDALEGLFIVTKSDESFLDEYPETETIYRRFVPKSVEKQRKQVRWVCEQVENAGLAAHLQGRAPLTVSVFVARDKLGLDWETASPNRPVPADWKTAYEESGIPDLCNYLARLVDEHGLRLKKLWPHKRLHALQRKLQEASTQAGKRLRDLRDTIGFQRRHLQTAEKTAADDAAQFAAGKVGPCLKGWCIDDLQRFNRTAANRELQTILRKAVEHAVRDTVQPLLGRAFQEMDDALRQFAADNEFDLKVRQKTRRQTYTSRHTSESIGRAVGGLGGAGVGAFFGSLLLPGIGTVIGSILVGLFGVYVGGEIAPRVWEETRTVDVPIGTNADEVICQIETTVRRQAEAAVADVFLRLDETIFAPLDRELSQLEYEVKEWPLKG
jgi:hypothetical protein